MWTHRMMLESLCHSDNAFVTLTYAEEHLPAGGSLIPRHLQLFLKRLRKTVSPSRIRFYGVGEYGEERFRPHYHLALFGYPPCVNGRSDYNRPGGRVRSSCCPQCDAVRDAWGLGGVEVGTLTIQSAQYVCGYVTKKLTSSDRLPPALAGLHPEFARMSNRPGIGLNAMHELASELMRYDLHKSQADVPSALRHGARQMPLGRYLRRKLRVLVGKEEKAPESVLQELKKEMFAVYEAAAFEGRLSTLLPKKEVMALSDGQVASMEARERIYRQRKGL